MASDSHFDAVLDDALADFGSPAFSNLQTAPVAQAQRAEEADRTATGSQASTSSPANASSSNGPQFGAVPPDLSDLPEDVSRGLSELMRELALVDEGNQAAGAAGTSGGSRPVPSESEVSATLRQLAEQSRLHGGDSPEQGGAGPLDDDLFARLSSELGGLGGLGALGGGSEGDLGSLAETIMHQLLSKDVLYEPMKEIGSRYPDWLEQHQQDLPAEELQRYQKQHSYITQICHLYETDPGNSTKLFELVQAMQACGNPPPDIVSEMSPGLSFDGDGLPTFGTGGESDPAKPCCIQ
ncbi:hypothetical protein WJX73_007507 [Symbiochloris irregularis]|uniref:Uncharacterized protein n=1 Tax=Symbiochloris irregularis TaxID=706552 RepID=A0AAW1PRN6_9CHLO